MSMNAIQYGKLKIVAKVAELSPAATKQEAAKQGGRGKKKPSSPGRLAFAKETIAKYRKVAANLPKLATPNSRPLKILNLLNRVIMPACVAIPATVEMLACGLNHGRSFFPG